MSGADRELVKHETTKSFVWLQTADGSIQEVEQDVAMFCPLICHEMRSGLGSSKNHPISLPSRVKPAMLSLIFEYCRYHQAPGHSNKERKSFDEKFIRMDTKMLCELTSAADCLQLKPLINITSQALARIIEGKTPEEIRETFHLPDDLTEEEKLEPMKNTTDDPRIRLLNILYARKRKELKDGEKPQKVDTELEDTRSVDDLLSFINGGDGDLKGIQSSKNKKKNRRKKDQKKNVPSSFPSLNKTSLSNNDIEDHNTVSHHNAVKLPDNGDDKFALEDELADGDIDDEIDPALKEEIDREVEDFARRLNSDWPDRMQEIYSSGQGRKPIPISIDDNGSLKKYSRLEHDRK